MARKSEEPRSRYVLIAEKYCKDVLTGKVPAARYVRLACQRQLDDLERSKSEDYPYRFDEAKAHRICKFMETLPYDSGVWATPRLTLEPWQVFFLTTLFGWLEKVGGYRRFRRAYLAVPRKNGKSFLAAGIGLYMLLLDGEKGAQVISGACNLEQASYIFNPAKILAGSPDIQEAFDVAVMKNSITVGSTNSVFKREIGKPKDGAGCSCALVDELHQHVDSTFFDTMIQGMAARKQPLALITTTAGDNTNGPCFSFQQDVEKTLEGVLDNPDWFGLIYGIDSIPYTLEVNGKLQHFPADDWTTEEALIKANPNWGVSVTREFLLSEQRVAIQSPEKQNVFKTKHMNVWCNATSTWLNVEKWKSLGDPTLKLEDFDGQPCVMGADLASVIDLASVCKLFRREIDGQDHYYLFLRHYVPAERAAQAEFQMYQRWVHLGKIVATPGNVIDYAYIKRDMLADIARFDVKEVAFDQYQSVDFSQQINAETGVETTQIPQNVSVLSEPAKWLEGVILDSRIHHDGDPVMEWMISNVVVHIDANENILPKQDRTRRENKIDGVSALLNCLVRVKALLGGNDTKYEEWTGF
jgi:phage terminase large subunit-like protein